MAPAGWRGIRSLSGLLREEPQRFEALQAVRLLEAIAGRPHSVHYRGSLGSAFPSSEIDRLDLPREAGAPTELTLTYHALAGAFGPLPRPLAELVAAAARRKDTAARDFLDLFNHRLIALLVELRRRSRPAAEPVAPEATRLAAWLYALLGLGTPGLHREKRLRGAWLPLDPDQTTVLGRPGRNRELGRTTVAGRRVWDQAAGLRVTLGPLPPPAFAAFLPGTAGWSSLRTLLWFALDDAFAIELALLPVADPANAARLGRDAPRLAWTAWLGARAPAPVLLRLPAGPVAS